VILHESYLANLEAGREFQDCAQDFLNDLGINPVAWSSAKYQRERGESKLGFEYKLDRRWRGTGNLAIEVAERYNVHCDFQPSGPYHKHKPRYLVIGDCDRFWQFDCGHLRSSIENTDYCVAQITTAKLVLIPISIADDLALAIYKPEEANDC
jgi:hypothetical protein